ncbi:hypothetical protein [Gordonia sp. (in: high G+C Gram-positive bacteria)]|uniref:hypothetical protein n=1 Tax=Gordonia sp. (in: high G+C Gram-positive bacteria) TaxID=84139 RepID=UPI003F99E155
MGTADPLVYASVAFWEYGCCGELPVPGARVSGTLSAVPARPTERFVVTAPFAFVADFELLRFDTWSTRWDRAHGDPTTQPITVRFSWHEDSSAYPQPAVTGTVHEIYEASLDSGIGEQNTGDAPRVYRRVESVERHPADFDARFLGLVVGFTPESRAEPSATAIADHAALIEKASRTISISGPATAFGDTAPTRGDLLRIDLEHPRLRVEGNRADLSGVVSGVIEQVSRMIPHQNGLFTLLASVTAGTPASSIDADLYVRVLVDRSYFS